MFFGVLRWMGWMIFGSMICGWLGGDRWCLPWFLKKMVVGVYGGLGL